MKTDYQKLNNFESATIAAIVIGLILIGVMAFGSLPADEQMQAADTFRILDLHDDWQEPVETIAFMFDTSGKFLDEFYVAFFEVAAVADPKVTFGIWATWENFLAFSDFAAATYNGQVAGASIEINNFWPVK